MKLLHRLEGENDQDHDHDQAQGQSHHPDETAKVQQIERKSPPGHQETGWKRRLNALSDFWTKVNNDWIFNLSGLLAYNLLMSIFPILLVLIAIAGFILQFAGGSQHTLTDGIASVLPPGAGRTVVTVALDNLRRSAGIIFVIGLLTAAFAGSRLFITIASCFNVIFRLRPRDALHQNLMAFGMLALYIVLVPFIFLASSISSAVAGILFPAGTNVATGLLIRLLGLGTALLAALILFAAIYIVVPNRPVHIKEVWRGTLTAGALLILYEAIFPLYQRLLLKPDNYGSTAGFAIVILVFFYYFAFILLLGAEVNSWAAGQRETAAGIAGILHEVQAHDTTRGAAGPTAGSPQEDLQNHEGKAAMKTNASAIYHERVQHKHDEKPPKFAAANAPNPQKTAAEAERTTGYDTNRPQHRPEPGKGSDGRNAASGAASSGASSDTASEAYRGDHDQRDHQSRSDGHTHRIAQHGDGGHSDSSETRGRQIAASAAQTGASARVSGPARPEYASPLPPEARDLPQHKPQRSSARTIAVLATAALPVVMWLLGRNHRHA